MAKKNSKIKTGTFDKIRDFVAKHPEQLFIVANPASDEILTSYAGKYAFVRFPEDTHVVMRVVSPDMFELAIDEFAQGVIDVLKTDEVEGAQFIKAVGGSVRAIGNKLTEDYGKEESK